MYTLGHHLLHDILVEDQNLDFDRTFVFSSHHWKRRVRLLFPFVLLTLSFLPYQNDPKMLRRLMMGKGPADFAKFLFAHVELSLRPML